MKNLILAFALILSLATCMVVGLNSFALTQGATCNATVNCGNGSASCGCSGGGNCYISGNCAECRCGNESSIGCCG